MINLSRSQGVTIFVSTHFMKEAARCDQTAASAAGNGDVAALMKGSLHTDVLL
jgi:ABC-type multidrug transport system ATPase subunit